MLELAYCASFELRDGAPIKKRLDVNIKDMTTYDDSVLMLVGKGHESFLVKVDRVEELDDLGSTKFPVNAHTSGLPKRTGSRTFKVIGNKAVYVFSDGSKLEVRGSGTPELGPDWKFLSSVTGIVLSEQKEVFFNNKKLELPGGMKIITLCNDYIAISVIGENKIEMYKVSNMKMVKLGSYSTLTKSWTFTPNCEFFAISDGFKISLFVVDKFRKFMEIWPSGRLAVHKVAWNSKGLWVSTRDMITGNNYVLIYDYLAVPTKRGPPKDL